MSAGIALLVFFGCLVLVAPVIYSLCYREQSVKRRLMQDLGQSNAELATLKQQFTKQEKELKGSVQDPVTQLPGWRIFQDRLQHHFKDSTRHQLTMGVMFIDINHFKMVNDALGITGGDRVLAEVAKRLQACVRDVDTLSRFSKDIFVVLLTQLNKPETAAIVAQRILNAMNAPLALEGHNMHFTASIGIALYPQDSKDAATLLCHADDALQAAKKQGKQVYQFHQKKIQQQSQRELFLYSALASTTTFNDFSVMYQPVMNVRDKTIECLDASFCWHHQQLGTITFEELSQYAEKQHKQNEFIEALFSRATAQFLHWQAVGFLPKHLMIPVRLHQLESSQFVYHLSQTLENLSLSADKLILCLDGDARFVSFDVLEKSFNMLAYLGVKIGINHFGSGDISFRFLKNVRVNYIKLDQSLIDDVAMNDYTKTLVSSLLMMAENMNVKIIASGVDSSDQLSVLNSLSCELMQGKLIGDALPEIEVESIYHQEAT